jgi:hypothetical protein
VKLTTEGVNNNAVKIDSFMLLRQKLEGGAWEFQDQREEPKSHIIPNPVKGPISPFFPTFYSNQH